MKYWTGEKITKLEPNYIFVYGANPEFRNGSGAAKAARQFGALPYGGGRGIVGQTYGIITKNLTMNFRETLKNGDVILYDKVGARSISREDIIENIEEFLADCWLHPELKFFIAYTNDNNNLNGYSSLEMFNMFMEAGAEKMDNVYFHESFRGC
jgi:hypothetical protein